MWPTTAAKPWCIWWVKTSKIIATIKEFFFSLPLFSFSHCLNTSSTAQGGGGSFKNSKPIGEVGCCESGMAERSHWWTERCLISLTLSLSLLLSFSDLQPTYLPIYLCIYLSIDRSICLAIYLSLHLSIDQTVSLSICLYVYLSVYGSIYLFIYLGI